MIKITARIMAVIISAMRVTVVKKFLNIFSRIAVEGVFSCLER
jgi:hypothetical protein